MCLDPVFTGCVWTRLFQPVFGTGMFSRFMYLPCVCMLLHLRRVTVAVAVVAVAMAMAMAMSMAGWSSWTENGCVDAWPVGRLAGEGVAARCYCIHRVLSAHGSLDRLPSPMSAYGALGPFGMWRASRLLRLRVLLDYHDRYCIREHAAALHPRPAPSRSLPFEPVAMQAFDTCKLGGR
jgi:hypothetical protein